MKPAAVLTLRLLAVAGFLISAYLLSQKLLGKIDSIAGCGGGSGCANVLGSRWSQLFGVPVTAFSSLLYAALFVATIKPSRPLRAGLAVCFAGAALWFFSVLIFELKAFCPWCTAAHLIGLTSAVLLFVGLRGEAGQAGTGNPNFGIAGGALAVIAFILGQLFGPVPDTYRISQGGSMEKEDKTTAVHARPAPTGGRVVSIFDDNKSYNTGTLPHLGPSDAPHVIVKYFDYTCSSCKDMHDDLHMVAEKHPETFCMLMLPVPLNRECNPHFPKPQTNHEFACELARLSLAAWRANPAAWPQVHETLFTRPVLEPSVAEIAVAGIVGEEALANARQDPWIEELLQADINDFKQFMDIGKTPKMPKLVVGRGRILHGLTQTPEILLQALEQEFKLPPAK